MCMRTSELKYRRDCVGGVWRSCLNWLRERVLYDHLTCRPACSVSILVYGEAVDGFECQQRIGSLDV